jgi:hypothetical protein
MTEKNYDFKKRMRVVHLPDRRDFAVRTGAAEVLLDESWSIVLADDFGQGGDKAATDFQDYLGVSMSLPLRLYRGKAEISGPVIRLCAIPESGKGAFQLRVSGTEIMLGASDLAGLWNGVVYLEDCMNLQSAPILPLGEQKREQLVRGRRVHSGCGIDDYPDWQLKAIIHAGFNIIDVFVKDFGVTAGGHCDINTLIDRAEEYGLGTFLYNYLPSYKHPDDPDAEAFFDSIYGELFRRYPKAMGLCLCGESLEFPSKDPATTGKRWRESMKDGIPDTRPSPGWWPCEDYPAYLDCIRRAVQRVKPDAEIVFNTYNWGWADNQQRRKFLEKLHTDFTVQITFEIFKQNRIGDLSCPVMDYTISATEPGYYFTSECENAKATGHRICATSHTIGSTWDFGPVPYVPTPYRWIKRFRHLNHALSAWGVDMHYETHHYGWWPNAVIDLRKANVWSPREEDLEGLLAKIAARDYGQQSSAAVLSAWRYWSEAMDFYVATNEDQYGPWRVGPAYPLIFQPNITRTMGGKEIQFPTSPGAHFGHRIIKTLYQPYENEHQSPGPLRYPAEIKRLEQMQSLWEQGLSVLRGSLEQMPANKIDNGRRLLALGEFIYHSVITTITVKRWWLLNTRLQASSDRAEMLSILDQLVALAESEIANARATIPAVEFDSRLGWEPSMEYVCDKWHLEWKVRQVESALREIASYRKMLEL